MFLNPAASELPLLDHMEFRDRLSSASSASGKSGNVIHFGKPEPGRQTNCYEEVRAKNGAVQIVDHLNCTKPAVPYDLAILKGYKNVALRREFVEFILRHPVAKAFYAWLYNTRVPDEHFYSTLDSIRVVSEETGTVQQVVEERMNGSSEYWQNGVCLRKSFWFPAHSGPRKCHGHEIRYVCNFGVGDLPRLRKDSGKCLMGNKFNLDTDPLAVWCQITHLMLARQK